MKKYLTAALRGRNPDNPSERERSNGMYQQRLEIGGDIANTITTVRKDSLVIEIEDGKYSKVNAEDARFGEDSGKANSTCGLLQSSSI